MINLFYSLFSLTDFCENNNTINEKMVWDILFDLTQVLCFLNSNLFLTILIVEWWTRI